MIIENNFFSDAECLEIIEYCHKKEKSLKEDPGNSIDLLDNDGIGGICEKSQIPTVLYHKYNFFQDNLKYVDRLRKFLKQKVPDLKYPLCIQSWFNIYRKGEGIGWHDHANHSRLFGSGSSYAANIFIGGPTKPGITYAVADPYKPKYEIKTIENCVGQLHFFEDTLKHMVSKNKSDTNRYTIGITVHQFDTLLDFSKIIDGNDYYSYIPGLFLVSDYSSEKNKNIFYE